MEYIIFGFSIFLLQPVIQDIYSIKPGINIGTKSKGSQVKKPKKKDRFILS
jgi:hypothetical protein